MLRLKKFALATFAFASTLFCAAPAASAQRSATELFRIENTTSIRIDRVYISPSRSDYWGYDRLSGYMFPNQYLDLTVAAGRYDLKVVDKDGDSCVISGVDVYEDKVWTLTNTHLLGCEILTASR